MCLSNREAIELYLQELQHSDSARRWFSARTLGDIARSKPSMIARVKEELRKITENDEDAEVRRVAERSIRELEGEFDQTSEKYNPQEPIGTLEEQYYLKRG